MKEEKHEGVRQWYARTTKPIRRGLAWAVVVTIPAAFLFFELAPHEVILKLQIFNGAVTIPAAAAIWIGSFVYLFLIPGREGGFRTVESTERMERLVREAVEQQIPKFFDEEVKPVLKTWKDLGEKLETRLTAETLDRLVEALEDFSTMGAPHPSKIPPPRPLRMARAAPPSEKGETS